MKYYKPMLNILFLILFTCSLPGIVIQIGNGILVNKCLPIEPALNYSYSQSIFTEQEIGSGGYISSVAFQYSVGGNIFLANNYQLNIYLGTVSRDRFTSLTDWVPFDSLQLVFQGDLQQQWFSSALPGTGWLTIPLSSIYNYSGTGNLVIAIDENTPGSSSLGDDFYCTETSLPLSLEIHTMTINPDPATPPPAYNNNPYNPLSVRPNLRIDIQPIIYTPHSPTPADSAEGISIATSLLWQSNADSWDVLFAPASQTLQQVAFDLTEQSWTPNMDLSLLTPYRWQVIAHQGDNTFAGDIWTFTTAGETLTAPLNLTAMTVGMDVQLHWQAPEQGTIVSYRILRNQQLIDICIGTNFTDTSALPNQTYWYQVEAVNYLNQISPPSNSVSVTIPGSLPVWQMSFDNQSDFITSIPDWTLYDMDNSNTWQFSNTNFPNEGTPMSWLVFNPAQTNPPITNIAAHNGQKMLLCIDSTNPPNNDWLISPAMTIQNGYELSFWARSYTADYGLERMRFLVSTTDNTISSFIPLSTEPWLAVPADWTQIIYSLSEYTGQQVYLAWQCVSWDAFALCFDDIVISRNTGNQDENIVPKPEFRIYPNPAKDWFRIENNDRAPFDLSIFNIKGQNIKTIKQTTEYTWHKGNDTDLKPGIYLLKINSPKYTSTFKLVIY